MGSDAQTSSESLPPALAHGAIEPIFANIWFVQGTMKMPVAVPMRLSRSMTIIRDAASGELTLVNSLRLDEGGLEALDKLGKVAHVVRLAGFHGRDDAFYRERYGATVHAIRGQAYERSMKGSVASDDGYMQPDNWLDEGSQLPLPGSTVHVMASSPPEGLLLLAEHDGVLISGDALQNMPAPDRYTNFLARLTMKGMGFYRPCNVGPGWIKAAKPKSEDMKGLLELKFDTVLPGHGDPVIGGAADKYRPSIESALARCR